MKAKKLDKWALKFFSILGLIVYCLIIISVLNRGLGFNYLLVFIILAILLFLAFKKRKNISKFYKKHLRATRILLIILLIFGLMARFSFVFVQSNFDIRDTLSDTGVHWYGAQQIIDDGKVDQEVGEYENIFPYLSSYTATLAASMSVFGKGYNAIVFSNVMFDLISCLCLYVLFSIWKEKKDIGLFAATVWAVNPLQVVFCGMPLAIVVVNTVVIISILCVFLILRYKDNWLKLCLSSGLLGTFLAIGNAYRPIFIVFLLVFFVFWLMTVLANKKEMKYAAMSCLIAIAGYLVVGVVPGILYSRINPYYSGSKSQAGWSFYVGANYETNGKWSSDDRDVFFGPVLVEQAEGDIVKANTIILLKGGKRYLETLSRGQFLSHFLNKTGVLFGDVNNSIYDLPYIFNFSKQSEKYKIIQDFVMGFYSILLGSLGYFIIGRVRKKEWLKQNTMMLFLVILISALFFASLLVEVMNRYSLPLITILIIIVLGLAFDGNNKKIRI